MSAPFPRDYVTDEGCEVARSVTKAWAFNATLMVFAAALFVLGFAAGQLFQQMQMDARAYEIDRRV